MDIHRPKPFHGVREFLKEYGIIVLGVLTALALEQSVEWLHTRSEVKETREALKTEISRNSAIALYSSAEDKCLFKASQNWVAWAKGGPRPGVVYPHLQNLQSAIWDLSKTGAVTHMPLKERAVLARYYSVVEQFNQNRVIQRQISVSIASLALSDSLNEAQVQRLVEEENSAGVMDRYELINAATIVRLSRELGAKPEPERASARGELEQLCRATGGPPPGA